MDNPYDILGVRRDDSEAEIRKAYRRLAKHHHPDLNPDKPDALARFQAINSANDILSDPEKRARYDRGEIDGAGNENPPERKFYRDAPPPSGAHGVPDMDDLAQMFGAGFADRFRHGFSAQGADAHYSLTVDFRDAALGAVRRLTLPDGRTLDVTIPPGLRDGHVLRLKGQGAAGHGGGARGDALVEISVAADKQFRRDGDDILFDLPVTLKEAVLGAAIDVPTLTGPVRLTIPPHSRTGTRLRLARRGIDGGHQMITLRVVLPPNTEPALAEFLRTWQPEHPFDPRKEGAE